MMAVIRDASGRHVVGHVLMPDGLFVKHVKSSVHRLKVPPGWACDIDSLKQAEALGARHVLLYDKESNEEWRAPLGHFWRYGIEMDRGFGRQMILPLDVWTHIVPGAPLQLGLFG